MSFLNLRKNKNETPIGAKALVLKKDATKKVTVVAKASSPKIEGTVRFEVLQRPHITEKATAGGERGCYVFEVDKYATKVEIARAVSLLYKVHPTKVAIVTMPKKKIIVKGRIGVRKGGKKAYVFLKEGEKIEVV